MHLVAPHGQAAGALGAGNLDKFFFAAEHGSHIEQPEPGGLTRRAFAAVRVGDMPAKHLIAAA